MLSFYVGTAEDARDLQVTLRRSMALSDFKAEARQSLIEEYGIAAQTGSFQLYLPVPRVSSEGSASTALSAPVDGTFLGSTFIPVPGTAGNMQLSAALAKQSSVEISAPLGPAVRADAVMSSASALYVDRAEVVVVFQLWDAAHNPRVDTKNSQVTLRIQAEQQLPRTTTCAPTASSATCTARITVPSSWFSIGTVPVDVSFRVAQNGNSAFSPVGVVTLQPLLSSTVGVTSVRVELPLSNMHRGDSFTVPVSALAGTKSVSGFFLVFETDSDDLTFEGVDIDANVWKSEGKRSPGRFSINGVPANAGARPDSSSGLHEILFSLQVTVPATASRVAPARLTATVAELASSSGYAVDPNTPAVVTDRTGEHVDGVGFVAVVEKEYRGMFTTPAVGSVLNTAQVTRQNATIPLTTVLVGHDGTMTQASPSTLECQVTDSFPASNDCSQYLLTEDTVVRGSSASITTTFAQTLVGGRVNVVASQTIIDVFLLDALTLTPSKSSLRAIQNFRVGPFCGRPNFQTTEISAVATFRSGSQVVSDVDVSKMIFDQLQFGKGVVATGTVGILKGAIPGVEQVSFGSLASARITVLEDDPVSITHLILTPVVSIEVGLAPPLPGVSLGVGFSVTTQQRLSQDPQRAAVFAEAVDSKGGITSVDRFGLLAGTNLALGDVLSLSTRNPLVLLVEKDPIKGPLLVPVGNNFGNVLAGTLQGSCPTDEAIEGTGMVDVDLDLPQEVAVSVSNTRLAATGGLAAAAGVADAAAVTVTFIYEDGREQDMTTDPRTVYTYSAGLKLKEDTTSGRQTLTVEPAASASTTSELSVSFDFVTLRYTQPIAVVVADTLSLSALPYPRFSGRESISVNPLNAIAGTGKFQQAELVATLTLSNGDDMDVSNNPFITFESTVADVVASIQATVLEPFSAVELMVTATLAASYASVGTIASNAITIDVTDAPVQVTAISSDDSSFPTTFTGVKDEGTWQARFSVALSDGTEYDSRDLFPYSRPADAEPIVLPNLLTFTSSDSDVFTIDRTSGLATIRGNSFDTVRITVDSVDSAATLDFGFAANLRPDVADVDIGAQFGVPVAAQSVGNEFEVDVRVNVGYTLPLQSMKVVLAFDENLMEATKAVAGSDWVGPFFSTLNDPASEVAIGGTPDNLQGVIHAGTVTFRLKPAAAGSVVNLSGFVDTLASNNIAIGDNPQFPKRQFVAGSVAVRVLGARRRRRVVPAPQVSTPSRARRSACAPGETLPCMQCVGGARPYGDVNGDCKFDISDSAEVLKYLIEKKDNPQYAVEPFQLQNMDVDLNGVIDTADADALGRVDFKLFRFVRSLSVTPSDENCQFVVSVVAEMAGGQPATEAQTKVYVNLQSADSRLRGQLDESEVVMGTMAQLGTGSTAFNGKLYETEYDETARAFLLRLNSAMELTEPLGVSLIVATLDKNLVGGDARTTPLMGGKPSSPYLFSSPFAVELVVNGNTRVDRERPGGYNPLQVVDVPSSTAACANACEDNPCANGAKCEPSGVSFFCDCPPGYGGETCADDIDACASHMCNNRGTCTDSPAGVVPTFSCACNTGFEGDQCENQVDYCAGDPCASHGECFSQTEKGTYECSRCRNAGWIAPQCQEQRDMCPPTYCQNGGICSFNYNRQDAVATCKCPDGWQGPTCRTKIDYCAADPCGIGFGRAQECTLTVGSGNFGRGYSCTCSGTWTGDNCNTGKSARKTHQSVCACLSLPCVCMGVWGVGGGGDGRCRENPCADLHLSCILNASPLVHAVPWRVLGRSLRGLGLWGAWYVRQI